MSVLTHEATVRSTAPTPTDGRADDEVHLHRRTIDRVLVAAGGVLTVALLVAGGLLAWGANFSADYVHRELSSQNVFFPPKEELVAEGREDLAGHGGDQVTTGEDAEAYASYIDGHLDGIADGKTYSEIDDRGAAAAVTEAQEAGASDAEVAQLQATADQLKGQRDTLFKGETLRGLLLSSYAWSTVGTIAGYAAIAAVACAALLALLTGAGVVHLRRTR